MSYVLAELCSPKKKNERTNSELQTLDGPCHARIRNQTAVKGPKMATSFIQWLLRLDNCSYNSLDKVAVH